MSSSFVRLASVGALVKAVRIAVRPGGPSLGERAGALPRLVRATARGGPFLLKTEMGAGHGGRSGRYDAWREEAFALSWIIERGTKGSTA